MAIDVISGFLNSSSEPLDVKEQVADQTERLAIAYPYVGLRAKQLDTGQIFEYIGTPNSNLTTDWELRPTVRTGTTAPDNADGVDGDLYFDSATNYLYEKVTGAWTLRTDLTGAQIFQGTVAPTTEGVDGDMYFRSNGDVYQKSGGVWGSPLFNIAGNDGLNGDRYSATSATNTVNIPTFHPTDVALTLDASTYAYTPGQSVVAAEDSTNFFEGTVKSYIGSVLTITSTSNTGTGSAPTPSWTVNLDGATGQAGASGKPGTPDAVYTGAGGSEFTNAEIDDVIQVDPQWTAEWPFIAYVKLDSRGNINSPSAIAGDKSGHLVSWNGTTWADLGEIEGGNGAPGDRGWSPVFQTATRSATEEVLQLSAWTGGTTSLPASLSELVGRYVSPTGLTTDINLATNIKGAKGDTGDTTSSIVNKTFLHPASLNIPTGQSFTASNPPTVYSKNFLQMSSSRTSHIWNASNVYNSEGNETIYVIARSGVAYTEVGVEDATGISWEPNLQTGVTLQVYASYNGTFSASTEYGLVLCEQTTFPISGGNSEMFEVRFGFKFPRQGSWQFKMYGSAANPCQWSYGSQIIYEIFVLHRN